MFPFDSLERIIFSTAQYTRIEVTLDCMFPHRAPGSTILVRLRAVLAWEWKDSSELKELSCGKSEGRDQRCAILTARYRKRVHFLADPAFPAFPFRSPWNAAHDFGFRSLLRASSSFLFLLNTETAKWTQTTQTTRYFTLRSRREFARVSLEEKSEIIRGPRGLNLFRNNGTYVQHKYVLGFSSSGSLNIFTETDCAKEHSPQNTTRKWKSRHRYNVIFMSYLRHFKFNLFLLILINSPPKRLKRRVSWSHASCVRLIGWKNVNKCRC